MTIRNKRTTHKKPTKKSSSQSTTARSRVVRRWDRLRQRIARFKARRPHRSFQYTRRRDYIRSLPLPTYTGQTVRVFKVLRQHRKTFLLLVLVYTLAIIIIGGVTSQDTYTQIQSLLQSSSKDIFGSGVGDIGKAGLLAVSAFAGLPSTLTVDQQIYLGIAILFAWLTTVWLLREYLLGRKPRLRDGLYNSGGPFLSTVLVLAILILQLVPVGIVALIYAGFVSVGILDGGFSSMLFWVFAALVATLVLYWITSTIIALVIVTLPGMYPLRAMRNASDIVISRRLRIMYRLLWGLGVVAVAWLIVMIPVIILVSLVGSAWSVVDKIPIVPYVGAILTAASTVWYAAYVYLFYRKVVDGGR